MRYGFTDDRVKLMEKLWSRSVFISVADHFETQFKVSLRHLSSATDLQETSVTELLLRGLVDGFK